MLSTESTGSRSRRKANKNDEWESKELGCWNVIDSDDVTIRLFSWLGFFFDLFRFHQSKVRVRSRLYLVGPAPWATLWWLPSPFAPVFCPFELVASFHPRSTRSFTIRSTGSNRPSFPARVTPVHSRHSISFFSLYPPSSYFHYYFTFYFFFLLPFIRVYLFSFFTSVASHAHLPLCNSPTVWTMISFWNHWLLVDYSALAVTFARFESNFRQLNTHRKRVTEKRGPRSDIV